MGNCLRCESNESKTPNKSSIQIKVKSNVESNYQPVDNNTPNEQESNNKITVEHNIGNVSNQSDKNTVFNGSLNIPINDNASDEPIKEHELSNSLSSKKLQILELQRNLEGSDRSPMTSCFNEDFFHNISNYEVEHSQKLVKDILPSTCVYTIKKDLSDLFSKYLSKYNLVFSTRILEAINGFMLPFIKGHLNYFCEIPEFNNDTPSNFFSKYKVTYDVLEEIVGKAINFLEFKSEYVFEYSCCLLMGRFDPIPEIECTDELTYDSDELSHYLSEDILDGSINKELIVPSTQIVFRASS